MTTILEKLMSPKALRAIHRHVGGCTVALWCLGDGQWKAEVQTPHGLQDVNGTFSSERQALAAAAGVVGQFV